MQLLAGLHAEGATICIVTHDPRYANTPAARCTCSTGRWWTASRAKVDVRWGSGARGRGSGHNGPMAERPTDIPPGARAPGYPRAPGHRVAFVPRHVRVRVAAGGAEIAATTDVVALEEKGYPTRYYLARDGVDMSRLEKTGKTTFCPFKGLATYYVIHGPEGEIRDAAWSYEQPYREAELVRDRLAFDAEAVEETVGSTP